MKRRRNAELCTQAPDEARTPVKMAMLNLLLPERPFMEQLAPLLS